MPYSVMVFLPKMLPGMLLFLLLVFPCPLVQAIRSERLAEAEKAVPVIDPVLAHFVREKHTFVVALDQKYQLKVPSMVWRFFDSAERGDWLSTSNLFSGL